MRIGISFSILLIMWTTCFIIVGLILLNKKRFEVVSGNNGHKVYLQYGDLLDKNQVINSGKRRSIVIPVNRCFDTRVDNHLVSEQTLHGKVFKQLYSQNIYTEESLNTKIQKLLKEKNTESDKLSKKEKPDGNRDRYPVGTVVDVPGDHEVHYLLWALSTFDCNLKAYTSMQEYSLAVQRLVEECNKESEGYPILIPTVGAGLSRTKKEQYDILMYLLSTFRLNKSEINCDIHIVVREDIKNEVAIMNLK